MGIFAIISAVISGAKLIWQIWQLIKEIKASGKPVPVEDWVGEANAAIAQYRANKDLKPLQDLAANLKTVHNELVGVAPTLVQ